MTDELRERLANWASLNDLVERDVCARDYELADAVLSEIVAAGYAVVPVELTDNTFLAIRNCIGKIGGFYPAIGMIRALHKATLDAAVKGEGHSEDGDQHE